MKKAILVYARCGDPHARGDFIFAGNVAHDLVKELQKTGQPDIDVFLITSEDRLGVFHSLYPSSEEGKVLIHDVLVHLASLTQFDAVDYSTMGFVFASPCSMPKDMEFCRLISPDTRLVYLGNAHFDLEIISLATHALLHEYPNLIEINWDEPVLSRPAGFGPERLGLSFVAELDSLPSLSSEQHALIPKEPYGFIYPGKGDQCVAWVQQYIELTGLSHFIWVGQRSTDSIKQIESTYKKKYPGAIVPTIQVLSAVSNAELRHIRDRASSVLVLSTGIESILEIFSDEQLPFYQDRKDAHNQVFVDSYLSVLQSILSSGVDARLIFQFAQLLFAPKPLQAQKLDQFKDLFQRQEVTNGLVQANKRLMEQTTGRIAPRLLSFMQGTRHMQAKDQLHRLGHVLAGTSVCSKTPPHEQALRITAQEGLLFPLKVVLRGAPEVLNAQDNKDGRTALHCAVMGDHIDCVRTLIQAQCDLNLLDKKGYTALDRAVALGHQEIIRVLRDEGALEQEHRSTWSRCFTM